MPLIVAIEPDKRQAHQLIAVVRERLGAELVLADTAERALAALGDRVPDLILTTALLSAKDESALADHLRALDSRAAHVQTLTVPVLGNAKPRASGRGMLSALLGDRGPGGAAPDGCDPAIFAEQCQDYLERARSERAAQHDAATVDVADARNERVDFFEPEMVEADPPALWSQPERLALPEPEFEPPDVAAENDVDLSSLLDDTMVEQLSAAIHTASTTVPVEAPPPPHVAPPENPRPRPARPAAPRPRAADPTEDDLFDPSRCGFAALLAKLDEITHLPASLPGESTLNR